MRPCRPLLILAFATAGLYNLKAAQPQDPKQIYAQIKPPSTIHWCVREAGDDPSGTIGNQCELYSECLGALGLQDDVDRPPFTGLSGVQVGWVRRCHQVLDDAVHAHPQIKGATATQDWLKRHVYPGTEAKPSATPPAPR